MSEFVWKKGLFIVLEKINVVLTPIYMHLVTKMLVHCCEQPLYVGF
jgi:hypothetical protein